MTTKNVKSAAVAAPIPVKPVPALPTPKSWTGLELTQWLVAAGAAADTGAAGNVPVSSQSVPTDHCAWLEIDPQGKPYANGYFYKQLGPQPAYSNYDYPLRLMIATPDECAAVQAVELDIQQVIAGIVYNTGLQFDFQANQTRVWNRTASQWVVTGQLCPRWLAGVWQVVDLKTHRQTVGSNVNVVYDGVDGFPSTLTFPAPNLKLPDMMNVAIQIDGNSAGAPVRVYIDQVNFNLS